jgi:hypothetical protein
MKVFARRWLEAKTGFQKMQYLMEIEDRIPGFIWRMAEGNPHTTEDRTVNIKMPAPILGGMTQEEKKSNATSTDTSTELKEVNAVDPRGTPSIGIVNKNLNKDSQNFSPSPSGESVIEEIM